MRGHDEVIELLNDVLTAELTAINQYFVQAEMCKNWGFERLYDALRDLSMEEMKDTQHLVGHILYLEGVPNMQRLNQVLVGENVREHFNLDLQTERAAVDFLREAITHCRNVEDYTTRRMFEEMIASEESHIDWLETQLETMRLVGEELYLNRQIMKPD